jgi:outer membrane protein OmpA-like peptidoglycan-associated protein
MKLWQNVLIACILLCLLSGCSAKKDLIIPSSEKRELIVLLPDPDGKTGRIQVKTRGGSQTLERLGYSTEVEETSKPPTAPKPLDDNKITSVFGSALSAQPDLTGRFASFVLYFESDTTKLTHESMEVLSEVVRTIKKLKPGEVYVVGYTDRVGAEEYNMKLSLRRTKFVRDLLVSNGVKSSTLLYAFHGEEMPVVKTEDEVPEPLNRRVEVIYR